MRERWVDNDVYSGRCRRVSGGRRLLGERRRRDTAEDMPSLAAQLRRLRVRLLCLRGAEERAAVLRLMSAAAMVAGDEGRARCAAYITKAATLVEREDDGAADSFLVHAMADLEGSPYAGD